MQQSKLVKVFGNMDLSKRDLVFVMVFAAMLILLILSIRLQGISNGNKELRCSFFGLEINL
jgi:hypothetical protein